MFGELAVGLLRAYPPGAVRRHGGSPSAWQQMFGELAVGLLRAYPPGAVHTPRMLCLRRGNRCLVNWQSDCSGLTLRGPFAATEARLRRGNRCFICWAVTAQHLSFRLRLDCFWPLETSVVGALAARSFDYRTFGRPDRTATNLRAVRSTEEPDYPRVARAWERNHPPGADGQGHVLGL